MYLIYSLEVPDCKVSIFVDSTVNKILHVCLLVLSTREFLVDDSHHFQRLQNLKKIVSIRENAKCMVNLIVSYIYYIYIYTIYIYILCIFILYIYIIYVIYIYIIYVGWKYISFSWDYLVPPYLLYLLLHRSSCK